MAIDAITRAYVRHYHDNGQTVAYVEWTDHIGRRGRTEGKVLAKNGTMAEVYGPHMGTLLARAICHGIEIRREQW